MKNYLAQIPYAEARKRIANTGRQIFEKPEANRFNYRINGIDITIGKIDGHAVAVHARLSNFPQIEQLQLKQITTDLGTELVSRG